MVTLLWGGAGGEPSPLAEEQLPNEWILSSGTIHSLDMYTCCWWKRFKSGNMPHILCCQKALAHHRAWCQAPWNVNLQGAALPLNDVLTGLHQDSLVLPLSFITHVERLTSGPARRKTQERLLSIDVDSFFPFLRGDKRNRFQRQN